MLLELSVSMSPFSIYTWEILILAYFPPGNIRSFGISICTEKLGRLMSLFECTFYIYISFLRKRRCYYLFVLAVDLCVIVFLALEISITWEKKYFALFDNWFTKHITIVFMPPKVLSSYFSMVSTQQMEIKILQLDWFQK